MWWMNFIVVPAVVLFGIYCLLVLTGFQKRVLSRKNGHTAESTYDNYADSARKQRRYASARGGQWRDGE
jgi:hypothetical protein